MAATCKTIYNLIAKYVSHTASEEEVQLVEEHLCVCDNCRAYLANFMDKYEKKGSVIKTPHEGIDLFTSIILIIAVVITLSLVGLLFFKG